MGGRDQRDGPAPIAVIGMSLRVPGASTPARFWRNLVEGRDCLSRPSAAQLRRFGVPQRLLANPEYVRALPTLSDADRFDAAFFDFSPSEAATTEPSHRLFLECAWEALEAAGVVPGRHAPVTGVFGGCEGNYREKVLADIEDPVTGFNLPVRIGNALDFLTTRVSHRFDLTGPSVAVMAACATSLMAIELAVQALRRGDCEVALAGGATLLLPRMGGYLAGVEGMLSPSGRLRPFDAEADGTIFGDGAGVVALRPLADALAAGNPIHAVIRGAAASNDGHPPGKESIVAPSPEGQVAAIAGALADAGVSPATIGYVEAHGTATRLGDPAELAALAEVYRRHTDRRGYCSLGSVKANIGHTRCGAGVASLIKACFALSQRTIPPLANFAAPNPRIDFARSPFVVDTRARPWASDGDAPRRAAVSSFGFGGSNVHVVLEEAPPVPATRSSRSHHLLVVSARDEAALERRIGELDARLQDEPALAAADVARTLDEGRRAFAHRAAFVAHGDRAARLGAPVATGRAADEPASVVFLFPGQGSQRYGAGRGLYASEPVFRDAIDACAVRLDRELAVDLRTLLGYGADATPSAEAAAQLRRTAHAQPALFAVGYATARLLMSWSVQPAAMLGHSLGEIVAACLADVLSLDDALALVAARARLMQGCEPGAMAAVFAAESLVGPWLPPALEIAAVNAPAITVVSGPAADVAAFCAEAERKGVPTQRVETSHAFHSRMMEPALPAFMRVVEGLALRAPTRRVISNATGLPLTAAQASDPRYWADHLRQPVRFSAGAYHALGHPRPAFVEVGPGSALGDLVRRHDPNARVAAMLPAAGADDEPAAARAALGALWCAGAAIDAGAASGGGARLCTLPTYPFQRARHWRERDDAPPPDPRRELYERAFRPAPLDAPALDSRRTRVVCGRAGGPMQAIADRLVARGAPTVVVEFGAAYARRGPRRYCVRPDAREDWAAVLGEVAEAGPPQILHFGSVTGAAGDHGTAEAFDAALSAGFFSLCAIVQAAHDRAIVSGLDVVAFADGLMRLDGETHVRHAEKATLVGATRDIAAELPDLGMRLVDVPAVDGAVPAWLVDAIVDEAGAASPGAVTCLRPGARHEEALFALPNLPESRPRLRDGGVVLITGGTGGLGLLFAGALYDLCRARFVLTAPWDPPPEDAWEERAKRDDRIGVSLAGVLALRARGAEVALVRADVSLREDVAGAIAFARRRFGALHGVIHAAGVLIPTSVIDKTQATARRVFAAKALGMFHLDALLRDADLDLFMPVSSQASQVPEPGQVDYAAANAVLDVVADNRAQRGRGYAGTIGWGPWQDIGIAADRMRQAVDAGAAERAMSGGRSVRDVEFEPLDHPVLRARAREADGALVYRGVLRRGHWLVDDHTLDGRPLLVGTAHLQLVATACADHLAGDGALELRDVAHQRPLFADERGTEIEVRFTTGREGERFALRSRTLGSRAHWVENTTGEVRRADARAGATPGLPAADAFDGLPDVPFGGLRLRGGPRWRWTRRSIADRGRAWHRIALPEAFAADLATFDLHPALFDAAISCVARTASVESIPHTYDAVRVHAPLEREILVRMTPRATGTTTVGDLAIVALDGRLLAEIDGCVMRPAARTDVGAEVRAAGDVPAGTRRIVVAEVGDLDSLKLAPLARRAPGPGEVEIEVRATGLNFRDVLTALGEMPGAASGLTPGSELAGVVTAVGPGVSRLAVGDAVAGIARGALATHVTTSAHAVAVLPPDLDFRRAAGVPIVFLTAVWALEKLARVQRGERVLIHAAAGGVGLAAIQVARRLGAEIYATAGDDRKRAYLRSLGVERVFDSRSLAFVDGVREATGGEGVDVVLNALAGPFIPASMSLLRPQGRFVEIGKRDLMAGGTLDLAPFLRNLSFAAFDLGQVVDARDPVLTTMLDALLDRFASGELRPLPTEVVPIERALDGFRRMARAQHVGKVVFEVAADTSARGAAARAFSETYGEGVPVDFGLDVFRRVLSWPNAPTYVLAMGAPVDGAGAAPTHARVAAAEHGRGRTGLKTPFRAPESEVEAALAKLWEKTLGVAPIGVDDDFVDLGGDSIEAIQIQHAIHREFDLRVKNTEFLADPTIAALARLIDARRAATATTANAPGMAVRA